MILSATSLLTAFRSFSGTSSIKKMSVYFLYEGRTWTTLSSFRTRP